MREAFSSFHHPPCRRIASSFRHKMEEEIRTRHSLWDKLVIHGDAQLRLLCGDLDYF